MDTFGQYPYGLRQVTITPFSTADLMELDASRILAFNPILETGELEGRDRIVEAAARIVGLAWTLGHGGISLDALQVLVGGALTISGASPNEEAILDEDVEAVRPYFKITGLAISRDSEQLIVVLPKCKVTGGPEGRLEKGQFWLSLCTGMGEADADGRFFRVIQYEEAGDIWTVGSSAIGGLDYIGG